MAYLVIDNCVRCKHMDCVEVCPVDCFYEGENMLVINPDECIDCGVCVPECPVDAIVPDNALEEEDQEKWHEINLKYSLKWPNITKKRPEDVPLDAEQWNNSPNKFEEYFSENPGKGN
jgi:ferredoxin